MTHGGHRQDETTIYGTDVHILKGDVQAATSSATKASAFAQVWSALESPRVDAGLVSERWATLIIEASPGTDPLRGLDLLLC